MSEITWAEWITIAAIILGPILAVRITRFLDDRKATADRRMDVFRTLMRTRRAGMSSDHVGALNLVEIEFNQDDSVMKAWRDLMTHFGTPHPRNDAEVVPAGMANDDPEARQRNERFLVRLHTERQTILARLLHAMALALNFKIEQLEIFQGGYTPQGWADVETEQALLRRFLIEMTRGNRALPVMVFPASDDAA